MSQRPSAPAGPGGAGWPGEHGRSERPDRERPGQQRPGSGRPHAERADTERADQERPDEEWPDDLWPGDAGSPGQPGDPAGGDAPGGRWAGPATAQGGPDGRPPRRARPGGLAAIMLAAAVVGAAIALVVHSLYSSPSAGTAAPGSQPSFLAPGQSGGNGQPGANGALPGGGPGGTASIFMIGKVTAVTSTSITISGPGHAMTAAVTGSTRVTGKVSGISGIRAGDEVSAQLTLSGGKVTAVAIQDPAQPPSGGSLP